MLSVSEVWSPLTHSCNQLVDWLETDIKQYNKHELPIWTIAQQLHAGTSIKQWLFTSQANHSFRRHCTAELFYSINVSYHSFIVYCRLRYGFIMQKLLLSLRLKLKKKTNSLKPVWTTANWNLFVTFLVLLYLHYNVTISCRVERLLKWLKLKHGD